jgi:hypothetical protein
VWPVGEDVPCDGPVPGRDRDVMAPASAPTSLT